MYAKLVIKNAKRSFKDYLIYIVTLTICVTLFYSFLSVSSRYYQPDIGNAYDLTILGSSMKLSICAVTLLLLFLIRFVNRYMLLRRQKEFAVQSIMGMEQKTIGRLFFAETLIMGLFSIGTGIFLGIFCSQFITAMLLTSYGKSFRLSWTLFPDTALLTVVFFVISFSVAGIFNIRTIRKTKIIDMLLAEKENEPDLRKSRWIYAVTILFELLVTVMLVSGIRKFYFYYDSRYALPVQLMFLGNILSPAAALLLPLLWLFQNLFLKKKRSFQTLLLSLLPCSVLNTVTAASVPSLTAKYYLPLGDGTVRLYLFFILTDLLFFICCIIYLAASLILAWKEKSPEHKYQNENLFFFGQIISKLQTASKTMTLTSITLMLAVFLFLSAPILTGWANGYLDARSMYDVQIYSGYRQVYQEQYLPDEAYEIVTEFLADEQIKTEYDCTFHLYLPKKEDFHNRMKYDFPIAAISLSDYNTIRTMLGLEQITLKDNEFTTHWKAVATEDERNEFLKEHTSAETDCGSLICSSQAYHLERMGQTMYNVYTNVLFVFPDNVCKNLLPVIQNRYIKTARPLSYDTASRLEQAFVSKYPQMTAEGVSYDIRLRTLQKNSTKTDMFVLQSSMLYGAVVLMVICLTVLSLQQLLDADCYRYRFGVLRKLGAEERNIKKLVLKQLGVWFGLPVTVSIAAAAAVTVYFVQTVSKEISAYIGFTALLQQTGFTAGILGALLICYFISTWMLLGYSIGMPVGRQ